MVSFKVNKYLIYSSSLFLVGNEIVKGFFWTPHQQMFIIFTPVIAIFLLRLRMNQKISKFSIFLVTFVLGFFPLAYGSLFLLFPSLVIIYLQNREVQYLSIMSLRKFIEVFLLAIFFVFPVLFWVSLVKVTTGSFYSHETGQYRQFIWILDALSFGLHHFLDIASHRLSSYLSLLTPEIKIAFIVNIILLIYLLIRYGKKPFFQFLSKIQYIYLNFIIFFIFFYFLGSYFERLYFNLFALNIFINIILLNEILFLLKKRDNKSMIIITSSLVFLVSTTYFFQILLQIGPYE